MDEDYIHAIRSGGLQGDKAIMSVYEKYRRDVRSCLKSHLFRYGDYQTDLNDVVHDSFIVMLNKIQFEGSDVKSIPGFWSGIARNIWLNQVKRNRKMSLIEDPEEVYGNIDISPETIILQSERYKRIDECIGNCGKRCNEILLLWLADYSMQEIADRLNLSSPAMARKIKHECFKKLKKLLANSNIFTT